MGDFPVVVRRDVFVPSPGPGTGVLAASYQSTPAGGLVSVHSFVSRSDTVDVAHLRYSDDNGRLWSEAVPWPTLFAAPGGTGRRHHRGGYLDPPTGRYLSVWTEGVLPGDHPLEGMSRWTLFYSVSEDGGRTSRVMEQVVQDEPGYDGTHPLPGVTVGRNCVMIGDLGSRPLTLPDGTILLPVQVSPTGPDGFYYNPTGALTFLEAMVLRGQWTAGGRISWRAGGRVRADAERSTRGLFEPTLALLADGRILMVMRGSNQGRPRLPGHKWFCFSADGGRRWGPVRPWTFSDGRPFFSPSSCSQLLRHSSGTLYWLGNICRDNSLANAPRYPLVIGTVDECTGLLRRDSLAVLDDRRPGESEALTLSNFYAREERGSGDLLLHLTRSFAAGKGSAGKDHTADALLYRVNPLATWGLTPKKRCKSRKSGQKHPDFYP